MQSIVTGLLLLVVAQGMILSAVDSLATGMLQTPMALAAAHLLMLGLCDDRFRSNVPIDPGGDTNELYSTRLVHWPYVIYTIGTVGLWWSFFGFSAVRLV